ncbi:hypothetical protein LPJ38_15180 [Bradyrhizobium daqingense]|uniref:Uncharacterized protein n=1 Tax=Bradyrhizobium daqingense TaxID=993502 RepID=A0A562L8T7_9BRAD|nr:hypothetical protein [Bradyrhizobium daqingense]TWI04060.1 hypothetical protein IQ17_03917 [Bradyrhizobium daqingense]UFS92009.1 hypothetical protein LPJ38_15180 [Bradyrhizobium daqingense]
MEQNKEAARAYSRTGPLRWLTQFDRRLTLVKGLSLVTVLSSLLVGYFQYLNSYREKVSAHAKENMQTAAEAFDTIATKFSKVQALQQQLFSDYTIVLDDRADSDEQALAVKSALENLKGYEEAQLALFETSELLARKAQMHIDWATHFRLNPYEQQTPTSDPLDQALLRAFDFDCDHNLPQFAPPKGAATATPRVPAENACSVAGYNWDPPHSYVDICPKNREKAGSNESVTIHWFSAKHQLVVMHYCLRNLHEKLAPVRSWAANPDARPAGKMSSPVDRDRIQTALDFQARRLNAFMNLATFHMDGLREAYRPDSFACHVPVVTSVVGLFNDACSPIKTTPILAVKR